MRDDGSKGIIGQIVASHKQVPTMSLHVDILLLGKRPLVASVLRTMITLIVSPKDTPVGPARVTRINPPLVKLRLASRNVDKRAFSVPRVIVLLSSRATCTDDRNNRCGRTEIHCRPVVVSQHA